MKMEFGISPSAVEKFMIVDFLFFVFGLRKNCVFFRQKQNEREKICHQINVDVWCALAIYRSLFCCCEILLCLFFFHRCCCCMFINSFFLFSALETTSLHAVDIALARVPHKKVRLDSSVASCLINKVCVLNETKTFAVD